MTRRGRLLLCVIRRGTDLASSGTKRLIAVVISGAVALSLLCVAAWMVLGGDPEREPDGIQIIAPAEPSERDVAGSTPATPSVDAESEEKPPEQITVYLTGAVVDPGVYTVSKGERLDAVLRLAGGATENADLSRINLAAYATDAAHYHIADMSGTVGPGETSGDAPTSDAAPTTDSESCPAPVNINTAGVQCLETLPGIGGVRAESIVAHREQAGPFASPEAITEVSGIGDGIYRRIADLITVAPR